MAQSAPRQGELADEVARLKGEPGGKDLPTGRRLALVECTPYPDGTVITIYRGPS